jgi:transposase InsO family protein
VARMMQGILQVLQTNHRTTTAYHQQTNGQVERLNHTFADMLSMYMNADH